MAPPEERGIFTQPKISVQTTEDVGSAFNRLLQESPQNIPQMAKRMRISRVVGSLFRQGRLNPERIPAFKELGVSGDEAAHITEELATFSGQSLNRFSQILSQLKKLEPEIFRELSERVRTPLTGWERFVLGMRTVGKTIINTWRASLVATPK